MRLKRKLFKKRTYPYLEIVRVGRRKIWLRKIEDIRDLILVPNGGARKWK